jgi:hypothetical protein
VPAEIELHKDSNSGFIVHVDDGWRQQIELDVGIYGSNLSMLLLSLQQLGHRDNELTTIPRCSSIMWW